MNGSGQRNILTNAAVNWIGSVVPLVIAFFLSPVLVNGLGGQRYGIWSLVESILAYLTLFDLGVTASVVRYVAKFEATADTNRLNRVFNTSLAIFTAAGLLALGIALAIAFVALPLFAIPVALHEEARWLLVLLGLNLALGLPLSVFPSLLDGLGRYPAKTALRTTALLVRSALVLVVVWRGEGLVALGLAITASNLLENVGMAVLAWRYLPALRCSLGFVDRTTFREIRGYSVNAFLIMVAGRVSFQTDALVIGACLTPEHITYFVIAARLVEYAKDSLRALTTVLTPAVSVLEAQGDDDAIRRLLVKGSRTILWLILPIQVGLFFLGKPFLTLWMGPDYAEASYPTLVILALPLALLMSQSVSARILYGTGRLAWYVWAAVGEAVANLLLSVVLVRALGIEGVAWGTAMPNLAFSLAVVAYICRAVGVNLVEYLRRSFLPPLLVASPLALGWAAAATWIDLTNWPSWIATGGLGTAAYTLAAMRVELGTGAWRMWRMTQRAFDSSGESSLLTPR
jgi:O-antigen/teichoic acid export membrane protein